MGASTTSPPVHPLRADDPPALGLVRLHGRVRDGDAGSLLVGRIEGRPVLVAWLGAGAETDTYARARFSDAAEALRAARPGVVVAAEDDPGLAPWVAVDATGTDAIEVAEQLLASVTLDDEGAGEGRTPDFRPHWWQRVGPGRWRIWPLPWPRLLQGYRWWTYVVSALIMAALAALALWIAALVLDEPPAGGPNPQPFPTSTPASPTPTSTPTPSTSTTRTPTRSTSTTTVPPQI